MSRAACIIVVSDRASSGEREDRTGPLLLAELERLGYTVGERGVTVVPDDQDAIRGALLAAASGTEARLIVTTGGTGIHSRDVTPEATRSVLEKELQGFGELMRSVSLKKTPFAAISRATAGTRGPALVVNLPGSPKGAVECLAAVARPAAHVLDVLSGVVGDCGPVRGDG